LDASFMHVVERQTAAAFVVIKDSKVAQWGRISAQKLDTRDPLSPSLDPVVVQSPSGYRTHVFECRHPILPSLTARNV
jgi:hypothetical protein